MTRNAVLPTASVVALVAAAAMTGATAPADWYPFALAALGVAILALVSGAVARPTRLQGVGLSALGLLAVWSFLSLAWAELPGSTVVAANRTATYAVVVALVALSARTTTARRQIVVLVGVAVAIVAWWALVRSALPGATAFYDQARLTWPVGSPNGLATLVAIGLWPLLTVAASREGRLLARLGALGAGSAIPAVIVLTASRAGALFALLAVGTLLAITPVRTRLCVVLALVAIPVVIGWHELHALAAMDEASLAAANDAGRRALVGVALSLVAGAGWLLLDRRFSPPDAVGRLVRRGLCVLTVVGVLVGVGVGIEHDAAGFVGRKWTVFKGGSLAEHPVGVDRYLTAGTNRYDFWRVAVGELRDRPLTGYGAGNWGWPYVARRQSYETPDNAHGAVWEMAADLGVPGLALYLVVIALAVAGTRRFLAADDRRVAAALAAMLVGVVGHGQVDWLWELFPVGLTTAVLLGVALAALGSEGARGVRRRDARLAAVMIGAVGVIGVVPAMLAERYTEAAYRLPVAGARVAASRAASLAPFSAAPLVALARVEERAGRPAQALSALRAATDREPASWTAWLKRAGAAALLGRATEERMSCLRVHQINPSATLSPCLI